MPERIQGILTPNITPVDAQGRVDEQKLRGYVDWLIDRGVDGLYLNGSTGEFVRFSAEERRDIVRIVMDQADGRVPVLAGAAEANVKATIEACDAYGELGVRAVAIVAPFYYRLSSEGVYAYFREIAENVQVDVTLYNIPLFASPIEVETVVIYVWGVYALSVALNVELRVSSQGIKLSEVYVGVLTVDDVSIIGPVLGTISPGLGLEALEQLPAVVEGIVSTLPGPRDLDHLDVVEVVEKVEGNILTLV